MVKARRATGAKGERAGARRRTGLRAIRWPQYLRGPDREVLDDLYVPALQRALRYDRCCAYFSSSVLAAAARGFGGLIQTLRDLGDQAPRPAVRLLVNEELAQEDLDALLERGDDSRLAAHLLKRFKTPAEALEKARLKMLAWLAASGLLEVRVGVMRHTGGILHAKYGLIRDAAGDALCFRGSGNESAQSLTANYEQLEISVSWGARKDSEPVEHYQAEFDRLWADDDPDVRTFSLPEAVAQALIRIAPEEPPVEEPTATDLEALRTAMMWQFLAAAPYLESGDQACDATAPLDLWPHQRVVVEDAARAWPSGRLLCDEVGMGKTIEAAMMLRRLLAGRGVRRALLLVPAGLLKQWQEELREKGGLLVARYEDGWLYQPDGTREQMPLSEALQEDLLIVSREFVRLPDNRSHVLTAPKWDLVLLDEAHAARRAEAREGEFNRGNLLLELLRELQLRRQTRGILLLSATPMQTNPWEPWDLLACLGVGGAWMAEFHEVRRYYEGISRLEAGSVTQEHAASIARLVSADPEFPPHPRPAWISENGGELAKTLAFATLDEQQAHADWLKNGAPLRRHMHRNTRDTLREYARLGLLPQEPPQRNIIDKVFDYADPRERDAYDAIEDYIDRRFGELEREQAGKGFVMTIYRRRGVSSPRALAESLRRRLRDLERVIARASVDEWLPPEEESVDPRDASDDTDADLRVSKGLPKSPKAAQAEKAEVERLLSRLQDLGATDTKLSVFHSVLEEVIADGRSALIFTEYTDTMDYLRESLRPSYGNTVACFSGRGGEVWDGQDWVRVPKVEVTRRLNTGEVRVLVCTDAASEGLNLQAAGALINHDLHWNPCRIEQRIGRIDRIGQRQATLPIVNLFLKDSVDTRVYGALRRRCGLFEQFVGPMQPVLAVARRALRSGVRRTDQDRVLREMERKANETRSDVPTIEAFAESQAQRPASRRAPVRREDVARALDALAKSALPVKARKVKGRGTWRLIGLGRANLEVAVTSEVLERIEDAEPVSLPGGLTETIARRLATARDKTPLVAAAVEDHGFRAAEVVWVGPEGVERVGSFAELSRLAEKWDGTAPEGERLKRADMTARRRAKQRLERMARHAREAEERALQQQLEAARLRLRRELGRTLRCLGERDLNSILHEQMSREKGPEGRYRQCYKRLGGYPKWSKDEIESINLYVGSLGPNKRRARIAGSEVDAALADPRWRALST